MALPQLNAHYIVLLSDPDVIKAKLAILRAIGGDRFVEIPNYLDQDDLSKWFLGGGLKACGDAYAIGFDNSLFPLIDWGKMKWLHGKKCVFVTCDDNEKGFVGKRLASLPDYFAQDKDLCKAVFNIGDKADNPYPKQGEEYANSMAPFVALAQKSPQKAADAFENIIHAAHEQLKGNVSFALQNPPITFYYSPVEKNVDFLHSFVPQRRGVKARTKDVVCAAGGFEQWRDYHSKTGQVVVRLEKEDVICADTLMQWNSNGYSMCIYLASAAIKYDRVLTAEEQEIIQENKLNDEDPGIELTPEHRSVLMYLAMQAYSKSEQPSMCVREDN